MMCRFRFLPAMAAAAALTAMTPAIGSAQEGDEADPLVARVGQEEIRMSEVTDMIATLPPQYRQVPPDVLVPFVVDQLAVSRIMAGLAREEGLTESEVFQQRMASAERAILRDVWLEAQLDVGLKRLPEPGHLF